MGTLDLQSFERAIRLLDDGLRESQANPESELLRDGVIQRFEYTYELSWKMLKRYLEATMPSPEEVDGMSFQTLIRTGSEQGLLLSGLDRWVNYRKARGTTSHTYDGEKAREIFRLVPEFLQEVKYLFARLGQKTDRS